MKKGVIYTIIGICLIFAVLMVIKRKSNYPQNDIEIYSSVKTYIYIVKEYNGKVAVFLSNSDSPVQVLDCKTKNLPPDAVEALATGIKVYSIEELQKVIEAYD